MLLKYLHLLTVTLTQANEASVPTPATSSTLLCIAITVDHKETEHERA